MKKTEPTEAAAIRNRVRELFTQHESIDVIEADVLEHYCESDLDHYLEGGARKILVAEIEKLRARTLH